MYSTISYKQADIISAAFGHFLFAFSSTYNWLKDDYL